MTITLVKIGGSSITNKAEKQTYLQEVMQQIARELQSARLEASSLSLVLGHGSGSFGHFEASEHDTIHGVKGPEQWYGFARVGAVAAKLNQYVMEDCLDAGLPVLHIQPSAIAEAQDGQIITMNMTAIQRALQQGLIPLLYGDVAFDEIRGGTIISTENILTYLAQHLLGVTRIILLAGEDGVYDETGTLIPLITSFNFDTVRPVLGTSAGTDVTGGMLTKVEDMMALVARRPDLVIHIINGRVPGRLLACLLDQPVMSTRLLYRVAN